MLNTVRPRPEFIARYDQAGPRYTSYPTAPQFIEDFSVDQFHAACLRSNQRAAPLSLYIHIPFCDTICYYCGCNKIVTANRQRSVAYLQVLYQELALKADLIDSKRPVNQLHFGGGTPTYLTDLEITDLMLEIGRHFNLTDDDSRDFSIEVHPGRLPVNRLQALRDAGFNRLSMGVQDFDKRVQEAVNRYNSASEVRQLCDTARDLGFQSISLDLIYGLPRQTARSFRDTLDTVIELGPDRLSLFNYAHMPHLFKTQKQICAGELPPAPIKLQILEDSVQRLTDAGYVHIGMDHFARPDDTLAVAQLQGKLHRNFQGYTTHGDCDLIAFGPSAISAIDSIYMQNHKDIGHYTQALSSQRLPISKGLQLNSDDQLRRAVITRLICNFELPYAPIENAYNIDFNEYFSTELKSLEPMMADGLVQKTATGIAVTRYGRPLIRRICMAFDAYLQPETSNRYSRIL